MNHLRYDKVLSRLEKLRWHPSSQMWSACCPAHDDRHPSLWVYVGRGGNLIARCASGKGCTWPAIVEATGTEIKDWFPEKDNMEQTQTKGKIVATFHYHGEDGKLLYQCCRIEPGRDGRKKDFKYRRPQPDGNGWVWNLEGVEKVLYRLPELLDPSRKAHPVFVVEGEGKVEALRDLGFVATSSPCGATHWLPEFGRWLTDRRVVVLPDNDEAGWKHALVVAAGLVCWNASEMRIIHLPNLPDKGDVVDWLAAQPGDNEAKKKALVELVKAAPRWERK